jgi:hypothetical protein
MSGFTRNNLILVGMIFAVLMQVEAAKAQFVPRRHVGGYNGGYYGFDAGIFPNINQTNAAYQQAWTQQKQYQAQTAQAQTAAWQNINRSAAQQASMQTQSMLAQRQSSQDWWYQQQSRKLAESKASMSYQPMVLPPTMYAEPAQQASPQATAAKEIMIWPTLLKSPMFDELRAKVEAPFRRAYVDKKPLTADDYRGILQAIEEIKVQLKSLSSQVVESEYAAVEGYLDELATDAQKRLDARISPKPATDNNESSAEKS